jgi:hypothetical protein
MSVRVLKDSFSHASCKQAMALAAKALMDKLQATPDLESNPAALSQTELELLNKVQSIFGSDDKGKRDD